MRTKRFIAIPLLAAALALVTACETNHTQPLVRPPATLAARNFEENWAAARYVLRRFGLPLYQQDKRDGVLVTRAEPGADGSPRTCSGAVCSTAGLGSAETLSPHADEHTQRQSRAANLGDTMTSG